LCKLIHQCRRTQVRGGRSLLQRGCNCCCNKVVVARRVVCHGRHVCKTANLWQQIVGKNMRQYAAMIVDAVYSWTNQLSLPCLRGGQSGPPISATSGRRFYPKDDVDPVPDLSMWRPWAGSLLEAPTLWIKCYNSHALRIVIITKYIYIFVEVP